MLKKLLNKISEQRQQFLDQESLDLNLVQYALLRELAITLVMFGASAFLFYQFVILYYENIWSFETLVTLFTNDLVIGSFIVLFFIGGILAILDLFKGVSRFIVKEDVIHVYKGLFSPQNPALTLPMNTVKQVKTRLKERRHYTELKLYIEHMDGRRSIIKLSSNQLGAFEVLLTQEWLKKYYPDLVV